MCFFAVGVAECDFGEGASGAVGVFGGGHAIEQFDGADEIHGILNGARAGHLLPEFLSAECDERSAVWLASSKLPPVTASKSC